MPKLRSSVAAFARGEGPIEVDLDPRWGDATRAAVMLAQGGIRVFPCVEVQACRDGTCTEARKTGECPSPGKHPRIKSGVIKATDNIERILQWAERWPNSNWGQALDNGVVIDIDVHAGKQGKEQWIELLREHYPTYDPEAVPPDEIATLAYRTGRGGVQLVFDRPPGVVEEAIPGKLRDHIDIKRGRRSYVMVPGSVTDSAYAVTHDTPRLILPGWLLDAARANQRKERTAKTKAAKAAGSPSGKGLSAELALPTDHAGKGNEWMTRTLGYLAAGLRREEDLVALARIINATQLDEPMAEADLLKTARSVIDSELRNHHGGGEGVDVNAEPLHEEDHGYLAMTEDKHKLMVLAQAGFGEDAIAAAQTYLNCGIIPRYVIDVGDDRYYDLEIRGRSHKGAKHALVRGEILVDTKKRNAWLAGMGYAVSPPSRPVYEMADAARLISYVEGQKPPRGQAAECLGWHGTDFLTPDGILRMGKTEPFEGLIPSPAAVDQATASYGTRVSAEEFKEVLREVFTFQDEEVAAVAMSWWAMCLLKGTYQASIAPVLYLDAPSGSGKTTGFFAFLVALAGNTSGSGSITVPRVRHQLASNRNGIVWVDDMSDMRNLAEVLRQAASKGTHTKTDTENNRTTISQHMVGNVLLSAEGMGRTLDEKAMRDRVVHLKARSVKGRRSHNSDRAQWWDIVDLLNRYGAATDNYAPFAHQMAGTAVAVLAEAAGGIRLEDYMEDADGRHAEKHAILRAGAAILSRVLEDGAPVSAVAEWIEGDADRGGENLFIGHLAGLIWRSTGMPGTAAMEAYGKVTAAPIFVEDDVMYVSPQHCADWVAASRQSDARDRQLGSKDAIESELRECGLTLRTCRAERRVRGSKVPYWRLTPALTAVAHGARAGVRQAQDVIV